MNPDIGYDHEPKKLRTRSRSRVPPSRVSESSSPIEASILSKINDRSLFWWQIEDDDIPTSETSTFKQEDEPWVWTLNDILKAWRDVVFGDIQPAGRRLFEMSKILNMCGDLRQETKDEELWRIFFFMFQDYVNIFMSGDQSVLSKEFPIILEYCGLCQSQVKSNPSIRIAHSHLQPRFIQDLVLLRKLPLYPKDQEEMDMKCFADIIDEETESPSDVSALPLLCKAVEASGYGCEDMFSKWEQAGRELIFNNVIENLKSEIDVPITITHHVYKFCISLFFRAIIQFPRKDFWEATLEGFRAGKWILRRHAGYNDVFPVYLIFPSITPNRNEVVYLQEPSDLLRKNFIRELLDSIRINLYSGYCVISSGPIHFVVNCSKQNDELELQEFSQRVDLLTTQIMLPSNSHRLVPICVQRAIMARAAETTPIKLNIPLAKCVLDNSTKMYKKIMAQHMIDCAQWTGDLAT